MSSPAERAVDVPSASYLDSMDRIVPILPMTHVWSTQGHENMSRMQFPLLPGYGITIHKAQGKGF